MYGIIYNNMYYGIKKNEVNSNSEWSQHSAPCTSTA